MILATRVVMHINNSKPLLKGSIHTSKVSSTTWCSVLVHRLILCCWLLCIFATSSIILYHHYYTGIFLLKLNGFTPGISPLLWLQWYESVYYNQNNTDLTSAIREKKGRFVSIAENIEHAMTYNILPDDTHKIICWSNTRSALNPSTLNLRLDFSDGNYKSSTPLLSNNKITIPDLHPDTCA